MKYKELIDSLTALLTSHKMVKEVAYLPDWRINEQAKPGRKYFLSVISTGVTTVLDPTLNTSLRISVMDILPKDMSTVAQIQSDCQGILLDLVKYIRYNTLDYDIVPDPTISIFEGQFADGCAGAVLDIVFETEAEDSCDLPFN